MTVRVLRSTAHRVQVPAARADELEVEITWPEQAGIGLTPARAAKAASERSRSGDTRQALDRRCAAPVRVSP
jgi:hypothetical protein